MSYLRLIVEAFESGAIQMEGYADIQVGHDKGCPAEHGGGECSCKPDVWIAFQDGSRRQLAKDGELLPYSVN